MHLDDGLNRATIKLTGVSNPLYPSVELYMNANEFATEGTTGYVWAGIMKVPCDSHGVSGKIPSMGESSGLKMFHVG